MAERSSELEQLNDFGTADQAPDDHAAERIAEQVGITGETAAATAYSSATLDDDANETRTLAARNASSEANLTTTSGATSTRATDDETDDDETALVEIDEDDDAATATTSPANAIVDASAPPEEIKASIENTRSEMSETINAIQEKLSIANITSQVKEEVTGQISGAYESVKHALFGATIGKAGGFFEKMGKQTNQIMEDYGPAISEAGTTVVRTAKRNPIPFALIGLGVGMILLGGSRKKATKVKSYRYTPDYDDTELDYELNDRSPRGSSSSSARSYTGGGGGNRAGESRRSTVSRAYKGVSGAAGSAYSGVSSVAGSAASGVSSAASTAASSVSSAASSAGSAISNVAGSAYNTVGSLGTGVKQVAGRGADLYEQQLNENPYSVGAVAFALGAVVGLALPSTSTENVLMGEYRENLLQKAQEAAGGVIDKVQQVAGEAAKTVQEEAKAQGLKS